MISLTLLNTFYITLICGILSVILCRVIAKTWVSANSSYWAGWIFVLYASVVCEANGWGYKRATEIALSNILLLHIGATAGFFIANIFCHGTKPEPASLQKIFVLSRDIVQNFSSKIYLLLFIVGLLFFYERINDVGFSSNFLTDAREVYVQRNVSTIARIGSHVSVIAIFMMILLGVVDSVLGINVSRLLLVILAGTPLGLANAGRIFLFSYLLTYLTSLLLFRSLNRNGARLGSIDEAVKIGGLVVFLAIVFSILGFLRGGYGNVFNPLHTILVWPASSIFALDSWSKAALSVPPMHGLNSLGWIADFLDRLSLIDFTHQKKYLNAIVFHFNSMNDSAAVIPRTIIPDLIMDFGRNGLVYGMMGIAFITQLITIRMSHFGIFSFSFSTLTIFALFHTIQGSILSSNFCVATFWAFVFSILIVYNSRREPHDMASD
jgi:oligosaccharide repeat unit polymerase